MRIDTFELWGWRRLLSPLDSKEIKSVNPKGNQSWIFIGRTDAEAEAPISWPPDAKSRLIGKDPDARKEWGQEERRAAAEDEMDHRLNGHELEQTPGEWRTGKPGVLQSTGSQSWIQLRYCTTTKHPIVTVEPVETYRGRDPGPLYFL